ncbi:MAG: beta-phosphoglucomutase [Schleiferiaceae bacterium]|nr:beta-phosphoglucomutase [Schleiferiaceae bacterium]
MIQGFLFDLDGVIVDTAKYHFVAWQRMASALGIEFGHEENEQLKGISRVESLERILTWGQLTLSPEEKMHWMHQKNQWYLECIDQIGGEETLPGVAHFLDKARIQGFKIALGSASKNAVPILERIGLLDAFDAIVDGTVVSASKPNPEVFLEGARLLGLAPEACLVFEDAAAGVEAAQAGGMACIGLGDPQVLGSAHRVIQSFIEIPDPQLLVDSL